jgi:hypothetical protein
MEPSVTKAWNVVPLNGTAHVKKPLLVAINLANVLNVSVKVRKLSLSGRSRLILQSKLQHVARLNGVVPTLEERFPGWQFTPDPHVAPAELEEFTGRRIVPTPEHLRGGSESSGDPDVASEVESVSTATTARLARAEDDLRVERDGRAAAETKAAQEAAARMAAETKAAQEAAARMAAETKAAQEAAARMAAEGLAADLAARLEAAENLLKAFMLAGRT